MAASRPFADGRHFAASERIDDGKPRPIVGISIAHRREAFHSPRGGKHQRVAGSSSTFIFVFVFVFVFV